jgi:hypothetical protein
MGYLMALFHLKSAWEVEDTLNRRNRHRKYMSADYVSLKTHTGARIERGRGTGAAGASLSPGETTEALRMVDIACWLLT